MSPFSHTLRDLRLKRKLRQKDAAEMLGYEQSYLSALENCAKGPPKQEFLKRVVNRFQLDEAEQRQLFNASEQSKRRYVLPVNASLDEYEICHLLEGQLGHLGSQQIDLIKIALTLNGVCTRHTHTKEKISKELEETKM